MKPLPLGFQRACLWAWGSLKGSSTSLGTCPPAKCFSAPSRHLPSAFCSWLSCGPSCRREKVRCSKGTGPTRMAQLARALAVKVMEATIAAHREPGLRNASCSGSPTCCCRQRCGKDKPTEARRTLLGTRPARTLPGPSEPPAPPRATPSPAQTLHPKQHQDGPTHTCGRE